MNVYDAASFGAFIKAKRKKLRYTQAFISDFSGLSISFISDVENGKPTVELGKVITLANLLGVDLSLKERD